MDFKFTTKRTLVIIVLAIALLIGSWIIMSPFQACAGAPCLQGVPFPFYHGAGHTSSVPSKTIALEFAAGNFLASLLVWLIISALVVFLLSKKQN